MEIIKQIILSIIQGLTEFIPISSSGHLAILQNFFGEVDVSFDVFIHLATLFTILVYFYKDILEILSDFIMLKSESENFKIAVYLIIASIPAGIAGFLLKNSIDLIFSNLVFIAFGFIISGMFLFAATLNEKNNPLNLKNTFIIGLSQSLAIFPGISRSGSTVSTGMLLGISKERAIRFSFLLAIPAIIGASVIKINKINFSYYLLIPFIITFLTGLLAIYIFIEKIKTKNLKYFAYYCWIIAILIILYKFFIFSA